MATHPVYNQLLEGIDEPLERRIFLAFLDRQGQRISRVELVRLIFDVEVSPDQLANNLQDRTIREVIERLQNRDFPILASSGQAGYILTDDDAEIAAYIAEISSRAERMREKVSHLYRARALAIQMREWRANPPEAVQGRLI